MWNFGPIKSCVDIRGDSWVQFRSGPTLTYNFFWRNLRGSTHFLLFQKLYESPPISIHTFFSHEIFFGLPILKWHWSHQNRNYSDQRTKNSHFSDPVPVHHILLADVAEHPLIHLCGEAFHDPGQIPGQIIKKNKQNLRLRVHYVTKYSSQLLRV